MKAGAMDANIFSFFTLVLSPNNSTEATRIARIHTKIKLNGGLRGKAVTHKNSIRMVITFKFVLIPEIRVNPISALLVISIWLNQIKLN